MEIMCSGQVHAITQLPQHEADCLADFTEPLRSFLTVC